MVVVVVVCRVNAVRCIYFRSTLIDIGCSVQFQDSTVIAGTLISWEYSQGEESWDALISAFIDYGEGAHINMIRIRLPVPAMRVVGVNTQEISACK